MHHGATMSTREKMQYWAGMLTDLYHDTAAQDLLDFVVVYDKLKAEVESLREELAAAEERGAKSMAELIVRFLRILKDFAIEDFMHQWRERGRGK